MKKFLVLAICSSFILACSHKTTSTSSATAKTPEQLVYEKTCARCHGLKDPAKYTAEAWVPVVDKMQNKGKFDDETKRQVLVYLQANAKK